MDAWYKPLQGVMNPMIDELLAVREGVIFACLRGFSHVVLEIDSLEVVNLWSSRGNSRSIAAPIVVEIGELVVDFVSFAIKHVGRTANVPTHLSAKLASTVTDTESWLESSLSFRIPSMLEDCNRMMLS